MGGSQTGGGICRLCHGKKTIRVPATPAGDRRAPPPGTPATRDVVCPECRGTGRNGLLTK